MRVGVRVLPGVWVSGRLRPGRLAAGVVWAVGLLVLLTVVALVVTKLWLVLLGVVVVVAVGLAVLLLWPRRGEAARVEQRAARAALWREVTGQRRP
jgi:hypothetical protein